MERRLAAIMVTDVVGYSRLIRADEEGTIAALKSLRADLIYPKIDEHHGRVVKLMGDVVIDGDDIQGDGVNVAARLEVMAAPGGICVSDVAYQSTKGKTGLTFDDLGEQRLKNIDTPIRGWRWALSGAAPPPASSQPDPAIEQQIKFCTAPDGVNIAYAVVGEGPPLVKAPDWMTHMEYDWQSPVWRHLLRGLAAEHSLVRFGQRANGLSDWDVAETTFESMVDDLAAVVDAVGLNAFR